MKSILQRQPKTDHERPAREYVSPAVNICETAEGYVLQAEMPGVNKQGLEILLEGNEIVIVGSRGTAPLPGRALFSESNSADFRRVFELDPTIDTSKISARMDQGVLTLTLPKSERVKPRQIKVE